jgi:hypothetical protein
MPIISGAMHGAMRTTLMFVRQAWTAKSNDYIGGEKEHQLPPLSLLQGAKVPADQASLFPPLPAINPLVRAPEQHHP